MLIYPAMDLMGGGAVRLAQGDFSARTDYAGDPLAALGAFAAAGATWAHVVDLDGARAGEPRQHALLARLAGAAPLQLQVAGGFRTPAQVRAMLDAGAGRVVIGSLAVKDPALVRDLLAEVGPERITLALDVRLDAGVPRVATHGWTAGSGENLWEVAARYDFRHLLLTDIGRDGMLAGPNVALVSEAVERLPDIAVQASGGVASLADLDALANAGAAGAIVGKALWEGRFTVAEAIGAGR